MSLKKLEEEALENLSKFENLAEKLQVNMKDFGKHLMMLDVNSAVLRERQRQNDLWGYQRHDIGIWLSILGEEWGEVCQAAQGRLGLKSVKDTDADNLYEELIHVAAVASAIAEQIKEEEEAKQEAA